MEQEFIDKFWSKVNKNGIQVPYVEGRCWEWTRGTISSGYGSITYKRTKWLAHRLSWTINNGEILKGICILHKCDNKLCVNCDHLFTGTLIENNKDRDEKLRTAKGERHRSATLTEDQVMEIRRLNSIGERLDSIAKKFGISRESVGEISRGSTWKHLPLIPIVSKRIKPGARKIKEEDIQDIVKRYMLGESQSSIGKDFGINQRSISNIVLGKTWKHITSLETS